MGTRGQGIFRSTDDGAHWEAVNDGLGTDTTVSALGVHGSTIYAGTGSDILHFAGTGLPRGAIYVSTNAGTSWQAVDTSLAGTIITSFAFDDSGGYAGTFEDSAGIYFPGMLSSSDEKQWTGVSFPRTFGEIWSLLTHNSEVFAGRYDGVVTLPGSNLLRSTNGGATWEELGGTFGLGGFVGLASAGRSLFAASERTLYISNDEGSSWNEVGADLRGLIFPGWVTSLLVQSDGSNGNLNLFVGASRRWQESDPLSFYTGIFLSIDRGATWKTVDDGALRFYPPPFQLQAIAATSTSLFLRTSHNGIWRRPLKEMTTSIGNAVDPLPHEKVLHQNYPNPFNPSTTIRYGLPQASHVTLTVFNTLGQQVATIVNSDVDAGYHDVKFDATNFSSGVYFYRITAGSFVQTRKLLVLR